MNKIFTHQIPTTTKTKQKGKKKEGRKINAQHKLHDKKHKFEHKVNFVNKISKLWASKIKNLGNLRKT